MTRQLDYSYEIDEQATIFEQEGIHLHAQALIEQFSLERNKLPEVSCTNCLGEPFGEYQLLILSEQTEVDRPILWLCHDIGGIIAKQVHTSATEPCTVGFSHLLD